MQKLILITLLVFLGNCVFAAEEKIDDTLYPLPQMAPEKCAEQAPDALLEKLMALTPRPAGVNDCSGCVDYFYEVYTAQLSKKTDADYPYVKKFRAPLLASFNSCMAYVRAIHHGNAMKHCDERVPGEVEWIIYSGAVKKFAPGDTAAHFGNTDMLANVWQDYDSEYTPALIKQIGLAIGKANVHSSVDNFEKEMVPILDKCLTQLATAEKSMTEDQKLYFRRNLVIFLTRFP